MITGIWHCQEARDIEAVKLFRSKNRVKVFTDTKGVHQLVLDSLERPIHVYYSKKCKGIEKFLATAGYILGILNDAGYVPEFLDEEIDIDPRMMAECGIVKHDTNNVTFTNGIVLNKNVAFYLIANNVLTPIFKEIEKI